MLWRPLSQRRKAEMPTANAALAIVGLVDPAVYPAVTAAAAPAG